MKGLNELNTKSYKMITSIRIDDNKKTPFKYIQKIKAFKNGPEFIFKPGVNVIVGKNGSGKSTPPEYDIEVHVVREKMCSELPSEALYFRIYLMMTRCLTGSVLSRIISGRYSISAAN